MSSIGNNFTRVLLYGRMFVNLFFAWLQCNSASSQSWSLPTYFKSCKQRQSLTVLCTTQNHSRGPNSKVSFKKFHHSDTSSQTQVFSGFSYQTQMTKRVPMLSLATTLQCTATYVRAKRCM